MIDEPHEELQEPKRCRRRWLWAILFTHMLFAVVVVGWWYYPRGDTRFVGKWLYSELDDKFPGMELNLSGNGTGNLRDATRPGNTWRLAWRSGDGILELYGQPKTRGGLRQLLIRAVSRITGVHSLSETAHYRVVEIAPEWMKLQLERRGKRAFPSTLSRISE